MSQAAIGVFDSGLGGLTVARVVRDQLPGERIVYLADSGRCPYGPRSQRQVREFSIEILDRLAERGVKLAIVACNTATAALMEPAWPTHYPFPVLGVIAPGARAAVTATRNGRIGLLATEGTVRSGAYGRAIVALRPTAEVFAQGCPRLVAAVEAGLDQRDPEVVAAVAEYVQPLVDQGIDTLILGCTHFPHLANVIAAATGPGVTLVDPAGETVREARMLLQAAGEAAVGDETLSPLVATADLFLTSGDVETFVRLAGIFWPGAVHAGQHIELKG